MTDQQQQARLIRQLAEENGLLRKREKQLKQALTAAVEIIETDYPTNVFTPRWRKVVGR